MQEEITNRSVSLIITGAKLTEQTLEKAIGQFLAAQKQPKVYRGKQSLKQLAKRVDPDAFIIVCDAHDVLGNGFHFYRENEI